MRHAKTLVVVLAAAMLPAGGPASAGIPRGLILAADEQIGDEETGTTIARGHAELTVGAYSIVGRADTIELRPKINEVLLKGSADIRIGKRHYQSATISCTLDFERCIAVDEDQPLPASALGRADSVPQ